MCRKQYGEYTYWCKGKKHWTIVNIIFQVHVAVTYNWYCKNKPQTDKISERLHTSLCLKLFYGKKGEK